MDDIQRRKRSFGIGYLLSLCGNPIIPARKEPVAYLYNGVRLPKLPQLPEWNTVDFQYAALFKASGYYSYSYYWCTSPYWANKDTPPLDGYCLSVDIANGGKISFASTSIRPDATEWGAVGINTNVGSDYARDLIDNLVWSNHDIYDSPSGGNLYLAASDPIPVYE